jgi:hypothetical protein
MEEIQRADPRARRRAWLAVACGAAAGLVLIALAERYRPSLEDWITRDSDQFRARLTLGFAALAAAISGSLLGFAVYLWRLGGRVVRAERFPPPGLALVRDTIVMRGSLARRRGRLIQLMAAALALVACGISAILWRLVSLLSAHAA